MREKKEARERRQIVNRIKNNFLVVFFFFFFFFFFFLFFDFLIFFFFAFDAFDVKVFLMFGVLNAKNLVFSTSAANALMTNVCIYYNRFYFKRRFKI